MADDIKIRVGVSNNVKAGMNAAVKDVQKSASGMSGAFRSMLGGVGFGMVVAGVKSLISSVSDLKDQAAQVDFSPRNFQILRAVAEDAGVGADALTASLGKMMNMAAGIGNDTAAQSAFKRLGISVEDVIASNPEQLFQKIADGLQTTGDKSAIFDIFGRGAAKLIPTLRELAGGFDAVTQRGKIISDADIARLDELDDKINSITRTLKGWGAAAVGGTVGFIEKVAGRLGAISTGATPESGDRIMAEQDKEKAAKEAQATADKKAADDYAAGKQLEAYAIHKKIKAIEEENTVIKETGEKAKEASFQGMLEQKRWKDAAEQAGKKQGLIGRLMGRGDRDFGAEADRASKIALDDDFRKQEAKADRSQKRQEYRAAQLLARASNPDQRKYSPQLQRIFDADQKQQAAEKLRQQEKKREEDAWKAQIDSLIEAKKTADNTKVLADLTKQLLTLK